MGAAATIVKGRASGKSSLRERISVRRMMVASARVASSMAKWSPMQVRGPALKGMYCQRSRPVAFSGVNRSGSNSQRVFPQVGVAVHRVNPHRAQRACLHEITVDLNRAVGQ